MDEKKAIAWIHGRLPFGSRPGLARIEALLKKLENPQDKIVTIHIGGTNGKGSTVTYLRCLLEELGLNVGTFTSPYIETFNERISVNGVPISNEELCKEIDKIKPLVDEMDLNEEVSGATEFEIITAIMLDYFYQKRVDAAIVEVGLGGTLDCTNVINPVVSGIVTIGMDHMDILGDTIQAIAGQKAGIIKPTRPVVTGNLPAEAIKVIKEKVQETESTWYQWGKDYQVKYKRTDENWGEYFDFYMKERVMKNLHVPLLGKYQTENAGVAIELFSIFTQEKKINFTEKDIRNGLNKAFWPGRLEKISEEPFVILDGAHNVPAVERLEETIRNEFNGREIYLLFSAIETKDIPQMLKRVSQIPNLHVIVTTFNYPNALDIETFAKKNKLKLTIEANWKMALSHILQAMSSEDVCFITGSLYFVSEVRTELLRKEE